MPSRELARPTLFHVALLLAASPLHGCETPPRPPISFDGGPRDAPAADAPPGDVPSADAGDADDAGPPACTFVSDVVFSEGLRFRFGAVIARGIDRFALAWVGTAGANQEVQWAVVPSTGALTLAPQNTALHAIADAPSLATAPGGFVLSFFANPTFDYEIYGRALDGDGMPLTTDAVRWTTSAGRDDRPALTGVTGGVLATWIGGAAPEARAAAVGAMASVGVSNVFAPSADLPGSATALTELDDGALAAWALSGDVVAQRLSGAGVPMGARSTLSTEGNADGTVDVASAGLDGVAVFGAVAGGVQVRARAFDAMGLPVGIERVIAPIATGTASNPSIARWGAGWAVAYRVTDAAGSRVELAAVDSTLSVVNRVVLGAAMTSGPTDVAVASDGRVGVVWTEADTASTEVHLARIDCP